eukprot:8494168-Pyramimonas_sp.AAC.1
MGTEALMWLSMRSSSMLVDFISLRRNSMRNCLKAGVRIAAGPLSDRAARNGSENHESRQQGFAAKKR